MVRYLPEVNAVPALVHSGAAVSTTFSPVEGTFRMVPGALWSIGGVSITYVCVLPFRSRVLQPYVTDCHCPCSELTNACRITPHTPIEPKVLEQSDAMDVCLSTRYV